MINNNFLIRLICVIVIFLGGYIIDSTDMIFLPIIMIIMGFAVLMFNYLEKV